MSLKEEIAKVLNQCDAEMTEEKQKFEMCTEIASVNKLVTEIDLKIAAGELKYRELKDEVFQLRLEHDLKVKVLQLKRDEMMSKMDKYEEELAESSITKRHLIKELQDFISENSGKVECLDEIKLQQTALTKQMKTQDLSSFTEKGKEDAVIDFNLATLDVDKI